MWQTFQVPSYGNTALCKWLESNPIEHNKMKQSVLAPIALIFTMLMIPKTNEHGLKNKIGRRQEIKKRLILLSSYRLSWQLGLALIISITRVLGKSLPHCFEVKVYM